MFDWLLRLRGCSGNRSFNHSSFVMQISDHKRETWALYHGLRLRPSHSREGCGCPLQRKEKIKISCIGDSWISHGFLRSYWDQLQRC